VIIPGQGVDLGMLATGLSGPDNVVDAPKGAESDPVWQEAFWYRGSGIPGDSGTAAIAGHVTDLAGKFMPFNKLSQLKPGDDIIIRDPRANLDVHFGVTETHSFSEAEASQPATLARIYGAGPAAGRGAQHSPDGVAHLTLMTCAGDFVNGSFNHRLVIFADRTS
jgi:sortase (surface protein transpeptidase)